MCLSISSKMRRPLRFGPGGDLGDQQRGERAVLVAHVAADAQRPLVGRRPPRMREAVALLHRADVDRALAVVHVLVLADERVAEFRRLA